MTGVQTCALPILSEANLGKADLQEANLTQANLRGTYLRAANCSHAVLQGADLEGAVLTNAVFIDANMQHIQAHTLEFADVDVNALQGVIIDAATARRLGIFLTSL